MKRRTTLFSYAVAALLAAGAAAQEADEIGPAVDTSAPLGDAIGEEIGPAVDTSAEPAPTAANPAPRTRAIDSLSLDTSQIIGNQELPQVLYIVPWKSSDLGDLVGRPVNTLLDEVLAPADREVFVRQVRYYEDLHGDAEDDS